MKLRTPLDPSQSRHFDTPPSTSRRRRAQSQPPPTTHRRSRHRSPKARTFTTSHPPQRPTLRTGIGGEGMGQGPSSSAEHDHDFFRSVQLGELEAVERALHSDPSRVQRSTSVDRLSPLHIAAANGRLEVLSMILERGAHPDPLNRQKQTPLMFAAIHGEVACVQRLIEADANILMFDSLYGRTCLHYAAYYGHLYCLRAIQSAANSTAVADSWLSASEISHLFIAFFFSPNIQDLSMLDLSLNLNNRGFARFLNVRDANGATPLHLAARQRRVECVQELLDNGALVAASTGNYICPGSTPLHLAARGGSLECIRALLARGADRLQIDSTGRIPYAVALKQNHIECARLLNPTSSQPLVWPSPLKLISELDEETKALLERALMEANRGREKSIFEGATNVAASPSHSNDGIDDNSSEDVDAELCCICFERSCTIEVQNCGHEMCAACILALCCHCLPDAATLFPPTPACPFCRCSIARLVVATGKAISRAPPKSWPQMFSEGNC